MSSALAIAAVSAVLKDLLDNGMIGSGVSGLTGATVLVSALAPDLIKLEEAHSPRLNIFMYHVTSNQGWRNAGLPSRNAQGDRISNPPLALDLHYMITAYAAKDLHAEILLGYAMQLLHEVPVITRAAINNAFNPDLGVDDETDPDLPDRMQKLIRADLIDQVELVKLTPESMPVEEMSKLWTAIQGHYRPTAAYKASVVLIESKAPARSPVPVLTRGEKDKGITVNPTLESPYPALTEIRTPLAGAGANLGDTITLIGRHLIKAVAVRFRNQMHGVVKDITPLVSVLAEEVKVTLPNPSGLRVGIYGVSVVLQETTTMQIATNEIPLVIAPKIVSVDVDKIPASVGAFTFTVVTSPNVETGQSAVLIVGDREAAAKLPRGSTDTLTFDLDGLAKGTYPVRLRIDGIESLLIDRTVSPPRFTPTVTIP